MKTVLNLNGNDEYSYDDNVSDMLAVCQTYCINNKLHSWFNQRIGFSDNYFIDALPVTVGKKSIACGDYAILKSN